MNWDKVISYVLSEQDIKAAVAEYINKYGSNGDGISIVLKAEHITISQQEGELRAYTQTSVSEAIQTYELGDTFNGCMPYLKTTPN